MRYEKNREQEMRRKDGKKRRSLGRKIRLSAGILLFAFSSYFLMDTFVLARTYSAASQQSSVSFSSLSQSTQSSRTSSESSTSSSTSLSSSSSTSIDTSDATLVGQYSDENIQIKIYQYYQYQSYIYVADVQVSSVEYLKSAFAQNSYGKNVTATTSSIAEQVNAILAINGDYYGAQEEGYVVRNGVVYRSTADEDDELLVVKTNGSFEIVQAGDASAKELVDSGAWQVYSFGPALIENDQISVTSSSEVGQAMASNPRTAIGQIAEGHYVFVVSDGRTSESQGLSLYQLAQFMSSLGVTTAYNLDGGGSSTMVFQGKVINKPTTNGNRIQERSVSDIVYIGS